MPDHCATSFSRIRRLFSRTNALILPAKFEPNRLDHLHVALSAASGQVDTTLQQPSSQSWRSSHPVPRASYPFHPHRCEVWLPGHLTTFQGLARSPEPRSVTEKDFFGQGVILGQDQQCQFDLSKTKRLFRGCCLCCQPLPPLPPTSVTSAASATNIRDSLRGI